MRIGFDAKRAYWNNTGLGNYSRFVINGLVNFFPQNDYLLYSPGLTKHPEMLGLETNPSVYPINLGKGLAGEMKRTFGYPWDKLDLFHGLSNEIPFFPTNKNTKKIVTIHDLLFLRYPSFYPYFDRHIYLAKTKKACQATDLIIATSEQTKQDIIEFLHVKEEKIKVHYQTCHSQFLTTHTEEEKLTVKKKYGIKKPYILQVGTLEERKNAVLTLQAFSKSNLKEDFELVLVGNKTPYCEKLYNFARKENLLDKIKFVHGAEFKDFPLLYQGATLAVYPSFFEGFGIPILEALYSKTPIITSQNGCFKEVGGEAANYIDPYNADDLCKKMEIIAGSNFVRQELRNLGTTQIEKFWTPALIARLQSIYAEIV